jgi:type IV pilus assembly protein PilC
MIDLCRSMRYALASGRTPLDTMQLLAKEGTLPVRAVARRITAELKSGWGLHEALEKQQGVFPPLFLALTAVGEESGTLPEVLGELEKYYLLRDKLQREFFQEIAWPVFQLLAAIFVVAGLIYVTDMFAQRQDRSPQAADPLGMGLVGPSGAIRFLEIVFGTAFAAGAIFWLLKWALRRRALVERVLLRLPMIGPCLRSMVLARFSVALRSLLVAGLPVRKVLKLAFLACDNPAFTVTLPKAEAALLQGNSITASVAAAGVFPEDFLGRMAIAEDNGQLPDILERQAREMDEQARRRLTLLNRTASWLVYVAVAVTIAFTIYRLFTVSYTGDMEQILRRMEGK